MPPQPPSKLRPGQRPKPPALKRPAPKAAVKRDAPNYSTSTTTGVEPNVAAALSYFLGVITGVLFLVLEKENRFVRFHAAQSVVASVILIAVTGTVSMVSGVLMYIPFLGKLGVFFLMTGLTLATFTLWILLIVHAFQEKSWKLPFAGELARKMV